MGNELHGDAETGCPSPMEKGCAPLTLCSFTSGTDRRGSGRPSRRTVLKLESWLPWYRIAMVRPASGPGVVLTRENSAMSEAWNRVDRDASARTPLHGGEHAGHTNDRGERWPRHILLGVSHASDDPARHRHFEIRATFDQAANGWVAQVAEQNRNEQPGAWAAEVLMDGIRSPSSPRRRAVLGMP